MAKLGDFISPAKNIKCGDGKYPVLSMTMHDGIVLQSDRFKKSLASADQSGYKVVDYGQLVVGFPIDEGVLYLQRVIEQGIMSPAYNVWDVDYSHVDPSYFELSLHSPQAMQYYKENLRGSTARRRSLPKEVLLELPLKMPSMDEQKRVATSIDKLTHLIDMRSKQLDKLDELVKSRFIEMFENKNYQIEKLGAVCRKITDGTHKTPTYLDEGITFISAKNIVNGELDFTNIKHISEEEYQEIQKRCQTDIFDILLSKSGSLGAPVIVKTKEKLGLFESLAVLKYDRDRLLPEFLCEQLKMDSVQRQFKTGTKGVAIKHLHLGVIADTDIIVPPLNEQKTFAAFVAQVDKSKLAVQKSLEQLEILKKALMQEYFG